MYAKQKGSISILVIAAIIAVSAGIGFLSQVYLGPDNEIETFVEDTMDEAIEEGLNLPDGSVNIDLSPYSKED